MSFLFAHCYISVFVFCWAFFIFHLNPQALPWLFSLVALLPLSSLYHLFLTVESFFLNHLLQTVHAGEAPRIAKILVTSSVFVHFYVCVLCVCVCVCVDRETEWDREMWYPVWISSHCQIFPLLPLLLPACPQAELAPFSIFSSMLNCFSCVLFFVTLWTIACQAPLSIGFSRQEYWSRLHSLLQGKFPIQGLSPALQTDCLPSEPLGKPIFQDFVPDGVKWNTASTPINLFQIANKLLVFVCLVLF